MQDIAPGETSLIFRSDKYGASVQADVDEKKMDLEELS